MVCTGPLSGRRRAERLTVHREELVLMEVLSRYVQKYSQLSGIQQASEVEYTLCCEGTSLIVQLQRTGDQVNKICRRELLGMKPDDAKNILRYLFDQSVGPETAQDVLSDICEAYGQDNRM